MDNRIYTNLEIVQDRIKDLKDQIEIKRMSLSSNRNNLYNVNVGLDLRSLNSLLSINVGFLHELEKEYKTSIRDQ